MKRVARIVAIRIYLAVAIAVVVAFGPTAASNTYHWIQGTPIPIPLSHHVTHTAQEEQDAAAEGRDAPPCDPGLYLGWDGTCWPNDDLGGK